MHFTYATDIHVLLTHKERKNINFSFENKLNRVSKINQIKEEKH